MTTTSAPVRPDVAAAAADAATHALVNCYLRETDGWRVDERAGLVRVPLRRGAAELLLGLAHRSPAGRHRFVLPAFLAVGGARDRIGFPALAGLLVDELAAADGVDAAGQATLLGRIADSLATVTRILEVRADDVPRLFGSAPLPFAESEQALLLGHLVHPTPKSRVEMSPADRDVYSPETGGRFPLRWLAVDRDLVVSDSAVPDTDAPTLARRLLLDDPTVDAAALAARIGDRVVVPAHPWELDHLRRQPAVAGLLDAGAVVDLGAHGAPVAPTTSLRTVARDDWPWQLKCSLHLRVTNSQRITLPKELARAVEAARLGHTEVGAAMARLVPRFAMVHDPAYLAIAPGGTIVDGFSVLFRAHRWQGGGGDVSAVATLVGDHPFGGRSRLGAIVHDIAARAGRPVREVGREWFARFADVALRSLLRLHLDLGLTFEPHQQNTLLELADGWPERCVVRDSQGYFHREAAHDDLCRVIPRLGEDSESIFPEALADERLVYYPFTNLALGVVNALGVAGAADEEVLLGDLGAVIADERARGGRYPATLLDRLLDDERWPCKANLRTRLHDLDELVGDIASQSAYTTIPNPLRGVA